jgi:hypothetical protein
LRSWGFEPEGAACGATGIRHLLHKLGARVVAGQPLYRIHACYPADLGFARDMAVRDCGYRLVAAEAPV